MQNDGEIYYQFDVLVNLVLKYLLNTFAVLKVAFFQKVRCVFQISKSPKNIFQKTILNLKFKFPANNTLLLLGEI